ncbi:helix-turn-helix domain-containing protein [Streptomyces sp. NPDC088124]|uniref:helix-turn-helix domain-containing protein n=1 Tax=Streptomyces sp. NPDC088124 TaxID=3154654 RepID=UPI00343B22C3
MAETATARDTRRATVRQLADQGMSARAIAAHLGIGKDTVRRDLAALGPDAPPPDARLTTALAGLLLLGRVRHGTPTGERHGAPQDETPSDARLTVALTPELREHLAVLAEADHSPEDAVRYAVEMLADTYRHAWDYDQCPRGVRPVIRIGPDPRAARPPRPAPGGTR